MRPMYRTEADRDRDFAAWITGLEGAETIRECIQCGLCSGSCPLSLYMDYSPRRLIHLSKEGFKDDVLSSFTIWLCSSCYACTARCPREIKVTDIMYALKRRAIEEELYPGRFPIPVLAREFGKMVRARGRINESRLVLRLMLKTNVMRLFGMARLGWRLWRTGRMASGHDAIRGRRQLETIMRELDRDKEAAA